MPLQKKLMNYRLLVYSEDTLRYVYATTTKDTEHFFIKGGELKMNQFL